MTAAALTDVTFWLSTPATTTLVIPAATRMSFAGKARQGRMAVPMKPRSNAACGRQTEQAGSVRPGRSTGASLVYKPGMAKRTPIVVGNWKLHMTIAEAQALVTDLKNNQMAVL